MEKEYIQLPALKRDLDPDVVKALWAFIQLPEEYQARYQEQYELLNQRKEEADRQLQENIEKIDAETVVLLSQRKADDYIEIDLDLDEMDITSAETKATYREVQQYVLQTTGLMVSNLNIAQIKDKCGFDKRENYNKPRTANSRQPKCTPEKEKAIMDAFRHFGMI